MNTANLPTTNSLGNAARGILIVTAVACALLEMVDATIINVALPEIAGSIGATRTEIAWIATAYSIANVIIIPLSGMLSSLFGRKVYFTGSVILFTFGSLMCGLSSTLWVMVFWRFLQGMAGGGLLSTAQSIVIDAYPPEKINTANTVFGLGVIVGPIIGPVLGGFIVQNLSWHWIFFVNLPIGAVATLFSLLYVNDLEGSVKPKRIDWWGIAFLAVFVSSLQFVLEEGGLYDWYSSTLIAVLTIVAGLSMIAFIFRELWIDYAAVDIGLLRNTNLSIGNFFMLIVGGVMGGSMFIFPLFVRTSLGWTSLQTGVFLLYFAVSITIGMLISRKILESGVKPKIVMSFGLLLLAIYLFMLSFSTPTTPSSAYILPLILGGLGGAAFMLPVMSLSLGGLRGADLAQGTGLSNMMKRLGGAVGIAVLNIFLDHQNAHVGHSLATYISSYSPMTNDRLQGFQQLFVSAGYAIDDARQAAYQMLGNVLHRQQVLVSYDHGYFVMCLVLLVCIPVVWLVRNVNKKSSESTGG